MIFSKLAQLTAIVTFVIGFTSLVLGACALAGLMGPEDMARYVGKTPGQAIDRGVVLALFAVALGTLAEINFSIRKATEDSS